MPQGQCVEDRPADRSLPERRPGGLPHLTGGLTITGPYRFESLTIKGIERRLDGIIDPAAPDATAWALEFQGQPADAIWYNLLVKMGLWGEHNPRRDVQGIGVFVRRADAPAYPRGIAGADSLVRAVYLDEVLRDWQAREPDNPYVLALLPLVVTSDAALASQAPDLWARLATAAEVGKYLQMVPANYDFDTLVPELQMVNGLMQDQAAKAAPPKPAKPKPAPRSSPPRHSSTVPAGPSVLPADFDGHSLPLPGEGSGASGPYADLKGSSPEGGDYTDSGDSLLNSV